MNGQKDPTPSAPDLEPFKLITVPSRTSTVSTEINSISKEAASISNNEDKELKHI